MHVKRRGEEGEDGARARPSVHLLGNEKGFLYIDKEIEQRTLLGLGYLDPWRMEMLERAICHSTQHTAS